MAKNGTTKHGTTKSSTNVSQTDVPAEPSVADKGGGGAPPKLRGLDSNPQGHFGPRYWQAFRDSVAHIYDAVSLPDPSEEARFTLSTRTYATPRGILMHCEGTACIMTRGARPGCEERGPAGHRSPNGRLGGHRLRGTMRASRGWGRGDQ